MPTGERGAPIPAALARHIAAVVAPRLDGVPGWSERELVARVSPRPVGGLTVWRTPLAGALAAVTGEGSAVWADRIREAAEQLPAVEATEQRGGAVDVRLRVQRIADLLPLTRDGCRLWHGPPGRVTVQRGEGERPALDRAGVFVEAVRGVAAATGDGFVSTSGGPAAGVRVAGPSVSREVAFGPVMVAADDPRVPSPLLVDARPTTPVRVALLLAKPGAPVRLEPAKLLARTDTNPGFMLVHTALALAEEGDCGSGARVGDHGVESLIVALASYPFVVEKGASTADPAVVLRLLLDIAGRCVRLRAGGARAAEGDDDLRRSAATVLAHGIEALGMRLPARV